MHEMLQITHGRRVAVQMWFACEGQAPGWAIPQRIAFEKEYGYGGHDNIPPQPLPAHSKSLQEALAWPWRSASGGLVQ